MAPKTVGKRRKADVPLLRDNPPGGEESLSPPFFLCGIRSCYGRIAQEDEKLSKPDLEKPKTESEKTVKSSKAPKEPKQPVEPKSAQFPTEGKLNKYGFVYLNDDILTAWLGHGKGTEQRVSIDHKDNALIIRKV